MKVNLFKALLLRCVSGQPYTADKALAHLTGAQVLTALQQVVEPGQTVVCAVGHSAFLGLRQTLNVRTCYFVARYLGHTNQAFQVQTANNYHEQLKTWRIQRDLRGLFTNWLPNYMVWHWMRTWIRIGLSTRQSMLLFY